MERKPPRLYIAFKNFVRISRSFDLITFSDREILFRANIASLDFGEQVVILPKQQSYETFMLKIQRSPNSTALTIERKRRLWLWLIPSTGLPYISDRSLELPTGYIYTGNKLAGKISVLTFADPNEPKMEKIHLRKDIVQAIYDLPNCEWLHGWE